MKNPLRKLFTPLLQAYGGTPAALDSFPRNVVGAHHARLAVRHLKSAVGNLSLGNAISNGDWCELNNLCNQLDQLTSRISKAVNAAAQKEGK